MTGLARRAVLAVLGGGLAALQQGCGFAPLHAGTAGGRRPADALAAIRVAAIGSGGNRRIGQVLRNELVDRLTAGVGPRPARYDLEVGIGRSSAALQVQTTSTVTRYNLVLTAKVVLRDAATLEPLYRETARSTASYDVVESEYATLAASRNAAEEAARDLSHAIADLLSLYFAGSGGG